MIIKTISDIKMDFLTGACRAVLPDGYWHNHGSGRLCHLTFDDGPCPETTPALLDLLKDNNIKATFFFTGENAERYPELVKRARDEGHEIGNHTHRHLPPLFISKAVFEHEVDKASEMIKRAAGGAPRVMRPPYGLIDHDKAKALKERDLLCVYWGAVAEDWQTLGATEVVRRIIRQTKEGSVIVLHESRHNARQCIRSTVQIVKWAISKGLKFGPIRSDV